MFRDMVRNNNELKQRYEQLKSFWDGTHPGSSKGIKPKPMKLSVLDYKFPPGVMNWLQIEIYNLLRIKKDTQKLYVINAVTPDNISLIEIETGNKSVIPAGEILDAEVDHESGELLLITK